MGNACPQCSPRRRESAPAACRDTPPLRANASSDGMVKLDGGAFLMGTDYAFGFALLHWVLARWVRFGHQ